MKKIFPILFSLFCSVNIFSQIDTEFWFAAPDLVGEHWQNTIALCLVTYETPATVTIYEPANMNPEDYAFFPPITVEIPARSAKKVFLGDYSGSLETMTSPRPFGLHIVSTNPITAYYFCYGASSDLYSLKGRNALGVDFIVPMQFKQPNTNRYDAYATIEVVATEDDTEVVFDLKQKTTATTTTTAVLTVPLEHRGYTYALKASNKAGNRHLHNTRITANKPIAVNSTDDAVKGGGNYPCDLIGEQIVPVKLAGKEYIAAHNGGVFEYVFVFPTENNTKVKIDGADWKTLNVGEADSCAIPAAKKGIYISANKPIIVFHMTSIGDEVAGTVLPPLGCTGSMEAAFLSVLPDQCYVTLLAKKEYINDFEVNGDPDVFKAADFSIIAGNDEDWAYARKPITLGEGKIVRVVNKKGNFHMGVLNGKDEEKCSYGYFSDYFKLNMQPQLSQDYVLTGDTLRLYLTDAGSYDNIQWEGPNGYTFIGSPVVIPNADETYSGEYKVTATPKDGCMMENSEAYITISIYSTLHEYDLCFSDSLELQAPGHGPYQWKILDGNGAGTELDADTSVLKVSPAEAAVYTVLNNRPGGNLLVNGNFQKTKLSNFVSSDYLDASGSQQGLSRPGYFAVAKTAQSVNPLFDEVYDHSLALPNSGRQLVVNCLGQANTRVWYDTIDVKPNTRYTMSAYFLTAKEGEVPAKLRFAVNGQSISDVIVPPNTIPEGSKKKYGQDKNHWEQYSSAVWESGLQSQAIVSIMTADGITEGAGVCIDDINFAPLFEIVDTFKVSVLPSPSPKITGDQFICFGSADLSLENPHDGVPYTSYAWYLLPNDSVPLFSTPEVTVSEGGTWVVEVSTANGCTQRDSIILPPATEIEATLDSAVLVCDDALSYNLSYQLKNAELAYFNVWYDESAKAAGFKDLEEQPGEKGYINVNMPGGDVIVPAGVYHAEVELVSKSECGDSKKLPVEVTVRLGNRNLMTQKWNSVLALYNASLNGGMNYTAYQWYKNGSPIPGATAPTLNLNGDLTSAYSVMLTLEDGSTILSCDYVPQDKGAEGGLPVVVTGNEMILDTGSFMSGTATFVNMQGIVCAAQVLDPKNPVVQMPERQGLYVLQVETDNKQTTYKIFVK